MVWLWLVTEKQTGMGEGDYGVVRPTGVDGDDRDVVVVTPWGNQPSFAIDC